MAELLLAGALAAGCQDQSSNSLLVGLTSDGPKPKSLLVSIFDAHGPVVLGKKLTVQHWPGTMEIDHLPASTQELRVMVATDGQPPAFGGTKVAFVAGEQARVELQLSTATTDSDGDGVPDEIDVCPTVVDVQQSNTDGEGAGDACPAQPDLGVAPDLTPQAMPDLQEPPDLTEPVVATKCDQLSGGVCDGFESGLSGAWTFTQTNGALTVDNTRAYRGDYSLKVHVDPSDAGVISDVRITESTTMVGGLPPDLYLRAFMYLPAAATNPVQLVASVQDTGQYLGIGLQMDQGKLASFDSVANGKYLPSTYALPTGKWFCLQWHAHMSTDTDGYMQAFIDSQEVTAVRSNEPTEPTPPEAVVSVGAIFVNPPIANPAFDLWLDEVAIGPSAISCTD